MESRFLLNVVIRQRATILKLLARKDEALLIRGNALLILDLRLDVVDRIGRLHLESNSLARQRLHKDLHTTTKAKHEMKGGFLLDVVVGESTSILELFTGEDESLLVGRNTLLVLNLGLDVVNGVGRLDLEGDSLASQGLDEDLHTATKTEDKVKGRFLLNVVVGEGTTIFKLLASEDQALLVGRNAIGAFVSNRETQRCHSTYPSLS